MRNHVRIGIRTSPIAAFFFLCLMLNGKIMAQETAMNAWPQWRGPLGTGEAFDANPPLDWSPTKNIRWKTPIPGRGHGTPIVWGDRVFITTAVPVGDKLPPKMSGRPGEHDNLAVDSKLEFVVMAFNRENGNELWRKVVREALPIEGGHMSASLASASPVTDGKYIYASFGSHGLYCLDFQGELLWERDFGTMHSKHGHGEGSSPVLYEDKLIVNWDHEGQSFIVALDKRTGEPVWKRDRNEVTSWSTPIVVEHGGRPQIVVCGTERVRSYDLNTGETLWECGGLSSNIVGSPVSRNGIVYVGSSYEIRIMMAIQLDGAKGDITGSKNVLWTRARGTPYVPSMLLAGDSLYFLTHYQNILTRLYGPDGSESPGPMRLESLGNIYASPVAANGYVFVTDREGKTLVIRDGDPPRQFSLNAIDEEVNASLAIVGQQIFLRGTEHLYCIEE